MFATDIKKIIHDMLCAPQVCFFLLLLLFLSFAFEHESSEHVHFVCVRVYRASVNTQVDVHL